MSEERFNRLEQQNAVLVAEIKGYRKAQEQTNRYLKEIAETHDLTLYGDGNGSPGLRLKVDRLDQRQKISNWLHATIGASLIVTLIRSIWHNFGA